jgi:hypothetical protein
MYWILRDGERVESRSTRDAAINRRDSLAASYPEYTWAIEKA